MSETRSIPHATRNVDGNLLNGYEASCTKCKAEKLFIPSHAKRLPEDVVANKFRQKGWYVMSGEILGPNCVKRTKSIVGTTPILKPLLRPIEVLPINSPNVMGVIDRVGLTRPIRVHELLSKDANQFRFRMVFNKTTITTLQLDKLSANLEETFNTKVDAFFFEPIAAPTYDEAAGVATIRVQLEIRFTMTKVKDQ